MIGAILAGAQLGLDAYSAFSAKQGQQDANQQQMAFNAAEAQKQRDYETQMFSTRYQTTRKDLEAAGYNPLLAFGPGPGVPGGASASANPQNDSAESSRIISQAGGNAAHMSNVSTHNALTAANLNLTNEMVNTEKSKQELNRAQASGKISIPGFASIPVNAITNQFSPKKGQEAKARADAFKARDSKAYAAWQGNAN